MKFYSPNLAKIDTKFNKILLKSKFLMNIFILC